MLAGDPFGGCSCIGDDAPTWKRDDVDELRARLEAILFEVELARDETQPSDGEERLVQHRQWEALWAEIVWTKQRLTTLTGVLTSFA